MIDVPPLLRTAIALLGGILISTSALAGPGDKAGWQYRLERRDDGEHQYLIYAARDNGPRMLALTCERDNDTFSIAAEDLTELVGPVAHATMALSSGPAKFTLPGIIERNPDTQAFGFLAEIPLSNGGMQRLMQTMPPLLMSNQPIKIGFGSRIRELPPVSGLLDPAKRFLRECFAQQ